MSELEHLKHIDEELYLHVWEGELKTYADGAIYQKQLRKARTAGRICSVPYQEANEVHTFWDLGRNDATSIWFMQEVGREHHFIDYYEASGTDLTHYARILKEKDYNYGRHYLPHDVVVTELSSNRGSRKEILEGAGVRPIKVVKRIHSVNDGIEQARKMFNVCYFDAVKCERGIDALANYQYKFNEETNTNSLTPLHNWASNGADAFRQYAQGYRTRAEVDFSDFQVNQRIFE